MAKINLTSDLILEGCELLALDVHISLQVKRGCLGLRILFVLLHISLQLFTMVRNNYDYSGLPKLALINMEH